MSELQEGPAPVAGAAAIVGIVQAAMEGARPPQPPVGGPDGPDADDDRGDDRMDFEGLADDLADDLAGSVGPSDAPPAGLDGEVLAACSRLDHSDTDNAKRYIAWFGSDLVVMETEGVINSDYFAWAGTHWDMAGGNDTAIRLAKQVGGRIALEADLLTATPSERRAMDEGERAIDDLARLEARAAEWTDDDKVRVRALQKLIDAGTEARVALDKRKVARRKFGISSKNKARIVAMKDLAACDLTRKPSGFNADPKVIATTTHTLRFRKVVDPECPDPETVRYVHRCEAVEGHRREDFITKLVPVAYDKTAGCPRFLAFLARFLPVEAVRRCVQVGAGLGLLGLPVQRVFFHYGNGANGKSVFLETLVRVFGALAASLPTEAIVGTNEKQGGQASPELARLHGVRFLRVLELPANAPLREDVVKKLTGGEAIPVRNLFKGFFEFQPVFIAHMSGNGYPRIDGTDNGIWRRMAVIKWPVTLEDDEQRDFEEVVGELVEEASGILHWLIEGALIYLRDGLVIPPEVRMATQEYRDEMDVVGAFLDACVKPASGQAVTAREMYQAYVSWASANGKKPVSETKFGRDVKRKIPRDDKGALHVYRDVTLHDVPTRPMPPRSPDDDY